MIRTIGRGEEIRKCCIRVNIVEMLCICVQKWENDTHTTLGFGGGWKMENDGGGGFH
jgi:hypothetical protein